ncbi:helix-turn-helix domain-containing protein [Anaerococcus tetradius]|uniref:helix-turn-helix domain-containing protein n=1 Tax=Anaerococcus tetradius TaxID=33036 RepID=UPI0023F55F0C|nr:helix-turn-helix transcriptional regulator [Anaerococcus tetradius]
MKTKNTKDIFKKNLNKLLADYGKTQIELAKYIGVSNTTVNNYVKGYNTPRMDKIDKIAEFFNVDRSSLISNEQEHQSTITQNQETIIKTFNQLNNEGQQKAITYTQDLVDSGKYTKNQTISRTKQIEIDQEVEAYRKELELQARTPPSSQSDTTEEPKNKQA